MADILKIIEDLRSDLWAKFGDVLAKPNDQDEVHMTYYAGELMRQRGHEYFKTEHGTAYTEKAMQDAFTAGRRIGRAEAQEIGKRIADDRMATAIAALQGLHDD